MTIVRFAPSPTGFLHIGGARTCLFNWLYARKTQGTFILRIEDTDLNRSEDRFRDEILDSLQWMGMNWDQIYYQSQRFDLYREYAEKLLTAGIAYKDGGAVFYKVPEKVPVKLYDLVHGEIVIDTEQLKDQVLLKSDGSPAYNFCCVVDDALMGVTHIIRGDDHIANTPKQILLYEALGFPVPKFAHIPMILGEDKSRMSKRHGATAISDYRAQGFLPEGLVNYLALLGWNPGTTRELFTLEQLVKEFSLKRVNKTAAVFDMEKLKWMNGQYIKQYDTDRLTHLLVPFLQERGVLGQQYDPEWLKGLIQLYRTRFSTLPEFAQLTGFFFQDSVEYDAAAQAQYLRQPNIPGQLSALADALEPVDFFSVEAVERVVREFVEQRQLKAGDIIHPLRVAVTGGSVSPGIFEVIYFLGKEKTLYRLRAVSGSDVG